MKQSLRIWTILIMMLLIVSSLWSQDSSRCYTYPERLILAEHNLERLSCLEQQSTNDSIITLSRQQLNILGTKINQYELAIDDIEDYSDSLHVIIANQDNEINKTNTKLTKSRRRSGIAILALVGETIIIIITCLL